MIELTRLNGTPMVLNSDLIKTAEASPDTMLTLINGEKLIVREETAEGGERVLAYRARLLALVARLLREVSFHAVEQLVRSGCRALCVPQSFGDDAQIGRASCTQRV